jgi:hypothetical protein
MILEKLLNPELLIFWQYSLYTIIKINYYNNLMINKNMRICADLSVPCSAIL